MYNSHTCSVLALPLCTKSATDNTYVTGHGNAPDQAVGWVCPEGWCLPSADLKHARKGGWSRQWHPTPVLLPGQSYGWRSLVGCSPWGSRRVGHDWATSFSLFTFVHWRRNWQPIPGPCLENPRVRGAWWAAIYGVAQSRTRMKRLRSSRKGRKVFQENKAVKWYIETC